MPLTKREIKHYKPLIVKKLEEMSVKDEIGYAPTGTFRSTSVLEKTPDGNFKMVPKRVPNYRAANLQRSLTKKLLNLTVSEVERFLATELPPNKTEEPTEEVKEEILIDKGEENVKAQG